MAPVGFIPVPFQSAQLGRFIPLPQHLICPAHHPEPDVTCVAGSRKSVPAVCKAEPGVRKSFWFQWLQ